MSFLTKYHFIFLSSVFLPNIISICKKNREVAFLALIVEPFYNFREKLFCLSTVLESVNY